MVKFLWICVIFYKMFDFLQSKNLFDMYSSMVISLGEKNKSELLMKKNWSEQRKDSKRIKIDAHRMKQLKLLLMLGFIKKVKTAYLFDLDSQKMNFTLSNENLLSLTYQGMNQLQKKIRMRMVGMKRKERQQRLVKQVDKQNISSLKKSDFSVTMSASWKQKDKIKNEIHSFQKLNLIIDRKDKDCCFKQNYYNLNVLMGNVNKVKMLVYRHYKTIQQKKQQNQIMTIKYYCSSAFVQFRTLISLLQNNVQKNQNYYKYLRYLKIHEPKIDVFSCEIQICLQTLLFYISTVAQLKRFYQISTKVQQIANSITLETINNITQHTIKLRHYLGYISKIISDPLISKTFKMQYKPLRQVKDIWKHIYQRKYIPKLCSKSLKNQ